MKMKKQMILIISKISGMPGKTFLVVNHVLSTSTVTVYQQPSEVTEKEVLDSSVKIS